MKKEDSLENVQVYEVGFHILSTIEEDKLQTLVSKLEKSITQNGGDIISEEFPKIKSLAYDIKKRVETKYLSFNRAYFGWIKFEIMPSLVEKIKNEITSDENVLRFIIVKTIKENTINGPKPFAFVKESGKEGVAVSKDPSVQAEKVEISEEEIDKSIDELVVG
jgi:ribosomal protein S6